MVPSAFEVRLRSAPNALDRAAARVLSLPLRAYRLFLSPLLGRNCRFEPSCSRFALEALRRHGFWRGSKLAIARLIRCHPWGGVGGCDPVPEQ